MDEKKIFYIGVANGEISQSATDSPWNFKIEATDEEVKELRQYFSQNDAAGWKGFFRAHIPFIEYHHDKENDAYDETLKNVYSLIYKLGDQEAKQHIEGMGILHNDSE